MIFIFYFSARFLRSTLGRLEEKYDWQDLTIVIASDAFDGAPLGRLGG